MTGGQLHTPFMYPHIINDETYVCKIHSRSSSPIVSMTDNLQKVEHLMVD